jgi:hypothetical protein
MKRANLEHIIRAAGSIAAVKEIFILGSQAILAEHPEIEGMPDNSVMIRSQEADILIPDDYAKTETIEGAIGEDSPFHETYGFYAQAIDETTCKLPTGWRDRLVKICNKNTGGVAGYCLETHDLMISKLYANREKDREYFKTACKLKIVTKDTLLKRLDMTTNISDNDRERIKSVINRELK